jgi:DNA-binding CsgD family transcriptional regulator
MRELARAIGEAARATTLEELALCSFPALARALGACPTFFAESAPVFVDTVALAGEHGAALSGYLRELSSEDPLIRAAVATSRPVMILERHVDRRIIRASRAYDEFHRRHDFEHHVLVRFHGDRLTAPGALSMGFTRGRRQPEFGSRELRIAELALPALDGAARRIASARARADLDAVAAQAAVEHGLTPAETRVLSVLLAGASNVAIARRLHVSIDTVKTHVQRILRKLGVESRARTLAVLRDRAPSRSP